MLPCGRKILFRSPFRSGRRSLIFARLGIKETGFTRVETLVSTLVPTAVGTANLLPTADGKLFARKDRTAFADRVPRKAGV